MKVNNKIISIALAVLCLLSCCSFSVFAADDDVEAELLDVSTFSMSASKIGVGAPASDDITSQMQVVVGSDYVQYNYPQLGGQGTAVTSSMSLTLLDGYYIRPDHEYNISFSWSYRISVSHVTDVHLIIYDSSGNEFSRKTLFTSSKVSGTADFNFILKSSELPDGYSTAIKIYSQSNYSNSGSYERFQISRYIKITDLDDDVSWFKKIINAIKAIPGSISTFFSNLGDRIGGFFDTVNTKINNFKDNVGSWFSDLKETIKQKFVDLGKDIGEFFEKLKNYLLYFQHPVTTNSDGVLIGADGKPVYTNPFESALQKVEDTVYDWLGKISNFLDSMEQSRVDVSGYLENGSTLINGVLKASPALAVCLTFAVGFFVIRKVVGR